MKPIIRAITTVITLAATPAVAVSFGPVAVVTSSEAGHGMFVPVATIRGDALVLNHGHCAVVRYDRAILFEVTPIM